MPLSDSVTMHLVCIVFYTALIATATALSSTSNPDDPYGYYDSDIDTLPPEQGADQGDDAAILPRFITLPATIVGKEGEPTILDCATENSERYGLVWQKDKETVAARTAWSKDPAVYQLYSNDSLLIKSVKSSTAGLYSCIVKITSTQNITLTHRVKLENAAEIISLHAENNATQLYTGDTLKLTCEVEGKPKPVIKWYFDRNDGTGAIEIQNQDHQSTGFKDTLIINGVSFKNNGTYRCLADNTKTADHKTIAVEVFVAPTVRIQKIYSKSKTVIGLDCIVQSSPLANIFWKRNGEILTSNNTLRRTKTSLKLILDDVDESDFGKYTCIAKNFVNTTEKDVLFVKPLQPQFRGFGTSASTGNDILTWTMISPVSIKHCMVYYKAENDTRHSIAATSVTKYEDGYMITYVPTVPNDGTYKFKVKCLSEAGWSDESLERNLGIKDSQISGGFRLLPSGMLFIAAAVLMNP